MQPTTRSGNRTGSSGFTLVELMVTATVLGVVLNLCVPRFKNALEQARTNLAASNIQSIWIAQRLYYTQTGSYAPDVTTLAPLLDPLFLAMLTDPNASFTFSLADQAVTATRANSPMWSGQISMDQWGLLTGTISDTHDGTAVSVATPY